MTPTLDAVQQPAGGPATGDRLARALMWRIVRTLIWTNLVGSLIVALGALAFHRIYPGGVAPGAYMTSALVGYAVFGLAIVFGYVQVQRRFGPVRRWLSSDRPPSDEEVLALVRQPRRQATFPMAYWTIACATVTVYQSVHLHYHAGVLGYAKEITAYVTGGLTAWALSYLFVERAMRPAFARAAEQGVAHAPTTMKTFPRLLFAWLATSGVPMVTITFALLGLDAHQRDAFVPIVYLAVAYLAVTGILLTTIAARAVTDPLGVVRDGLRSVARGDLHVVLPVGDGGEIGMLQADFNRMAAELRDREELRVLFGRQVGAEVARRALSGATGLGGERVGATVMFVKLLMRTPIDTQTPEQVVAILNGFFDLMVDKVTLEGGLVNKFKSDGAMCVFGAPTTLEQHADCALRAARALRTELMWLTDEHGVDAAISISSGDVVAGNVGTADRYEFTVIGDPVNEAARLVVAAAEHPTRVLASASAIGASGPESANWIASRKLSLRGRRQPTVAYAPWNV